MTTNQMREWIIKAYPNSVNWRPKVMAMPDSQVVAIYHNMLERGKFDKKPKAENPPDNEFRQMTIYDYIKEGSM